jgi:hypothetical protein
MPPTLPANLRPGAEVWALIHEGGRWRPKLIGRVLRATRSGYVVGNDNSRLLGYSECPLFASLAEADAWARENPPAMPRPPETCGNQR